DSKYVMRITHNTTQCPDHSRRQISGGRCAAGPSRGVHETGCCANCHHSWKSGRGHAFAMHLRWYIDAGRNAGAKHDSVTKPDTILVVGGQPGPDLWKVSKGDHAPWIL